MFNDLQWTLVGIGVIVVAAVFGYNKYQEAQLRKRIGGGLAGRADDALLDTPTIERRRAAEERADQLPPAYADVGDEAPRTVPASERVEHTLGLPDDEGPIGAVDPSGDETIAPAPAGVLSERLDYIATLDFEVPHAGEEILRVGTEMVQSAKAVGWEGFDSLNERWTLIQPTVGYTQARVGVQLVDRQGVLTDADIVDFCQRVQAFATTVVANTGFPGRAGALRTAAALDKVCADVDIQVGFNVIRHDGPGIPGERVRALAMESGCELAGDGRFRKLDEAGAELFSLANLEPTPFSPANLERIATHGVTVMLDVPRAPDADGSFSRFAEFANHAASALGGQLVDDNRQPISPQALAAIGQAIAAARLGLREAGVPAGSPLALRLFS